MGPYDRVRVATDRFSSSGVPRGSVGYVIERHADGALEVEFSDAHTGTTWATVVADPSDLRLAPEEEGQA